MGECVSSLCERQKNENVEEDKINYIDENIDHLEAPERTKKNKTRIPKNIIIVEEEEDDEEISVSKHISDTSVIKKLVQIMKKHENTEINEKIEIARKNWQKLIDKLIQKRIDILREMVKKEKAEQEDDEEEEDEKIEDFEKENKLEENNENKR